MEIAVPLPDAENDTAPDSGGSLRPLNPLDFLGYSLQRQIERVAADRAAIEQRWVEDLQQYLGQYDSDMLAKLAADERSSVFLNITRVMVNQSESQLSDLLFPAEDKNWGLGPTPNPQIAKDLNDEAPVRAPDGSTLIDGDTQQPVTQGDLARQALRIAKEKATNMERTLTDQLVECDYSGEARQALHWGAVFGTAILCGPEKSGKEIHRFERRTQPDGTVAQTLVSTPSKAASARAVAPWDFYPDMSTADVKDAQFVFERSFMTPKQLRRLAKRAGYQTSQIRALLNESPGSTHISAASAVSTLRELTNTTNTTDESRYEIWTYRGPIPKEALIEAGTALDENDPLDEMDGVVVFCGAHPIRLALNPLDSEDWPYSVWCWQRDDFAIFGYGVPWLCRNEQRIVNTAWRMMLDNASKSAGPQVVAKRSAISPADGDPALTPWKVWWADETIADTRQAFTVFPFPSMQQETSNILLMAKTFLNETAGLPPMVGQGQGQTPNTLGGMAMLMNSSNTDRRRQVRDWDDRVTKPLITRFYHWNMQYSEDESIKGDYEVHARGSSALLLREQQAINLMALLDKYAAHPALAPVLKASAALRKIVQALHISPEELVKTEDELLAEAKAAAEQGDGPPEDPQIIVEQMRSEQIRMRSEFTQQLETMKAQFEQTEREADRQLRRDLAVLESDKADRQLQMQALQFSQTTNTNYQKILADLKKARWRMNLDKGRFDKELQLKMEKGPRANEGLE